MADRLHSRNPPDVARIIAKPVKAAEVVTHFLHSDPAEGARRQVTFLNCWLKVGDGGKGVKRLLERRRAAELHSVSV